MFARVIQVAPTCTQILSFPSRSIKSRTAASAAQILARSKQRFSKLSYLKKSLPSAAHQIVYQYDAIESQEGWEQEEGMVSSGLKSLEGCSCFCVFMIPYSVVVALA